MEEDVLPRFDMLVNSELHECDEDLESYISDELSLHLKHNSGASYDQIHVPAFDKIGFGSENITTNCDTASRDETKTLTAGESTLEKTAGQKYWDEKIHNPSVNDSLENPSNMNFERLSGCYACPSLLKSENTFINTQEKRLNFDRRFGTAKEICLPVEQNNNTDTDVIHTVAQCGEIYPSYQDNAKVDTELFLKESDSKDITQFDISDMSLLDSDKARSSSHCVRDPQNGMQHNDTVVMDTVTPDSMDVQDMIYCDNTKTIDESTENDGSRGKVFHSVAGTLDLKHGAYIEIMDDPTEDSDPEKDAFLTVLGTLLVLLCIEIYSNANKAEREETDMLESSDDLALDLLFHADLTELQGASQEGRRNSINVPHRKTNTHSKAAKRRKKQQQKILKAANKGKNSRNRFADNFEDLRSTTYEDLTADVDQSLTCPVCLEMFYLPCLCQPCGHIFCDPCLRRLTGHGSEGVLCPLCRRVIQCCVLDKDFSEQLVVSHPDAFFMRRSVENRSKYRHFQLPFTPPTPLSERVLRHLVTGRNNIVVNQGSLYNLSKLLFGCLTGACISLLIMLLCQKTWNDYNFRAFPHFIVEPDKLNVTRHSPSYSETVEVYYRNAVSTSKYRADLEDDNNLTECNLPDLGIDVETE